MEKMFKRLLSNTLSFATTLLIMAAPVAAVIYASEPATAVESFSLAESTPAAAYAQAPNNEHPLYDIYEGDDLVRSTFSPK
ncbi:hypothetical protein [Sporomusa termitida]|uniref:Uncharacterized protein n=1 Tax=Sporomusa termitida TaxID=2377 RepID=A0A517DY80_9FIRM|nr:hypothetical protein [Sporomusa termitida]QDR82302.1 hypothetical protein SPTER_37270 [Sporomusa termitida]